MAAAGDGKAARPRSDDGNVVAQGQRVRVQTAGSRDGKTRAVRKTHIRRVQGGLFAYVQRSTADREEVRVSSALQSEDR